MVALFMPWRASQAISICDYPYLQNKAEDSLAGGRRKVLIKQNFSCGSLPTKITVINPNKLEYYLRSMRA